MYKDIVIVSAVRTPFGRYCGALREYDYFDLGALPMKDVLARVDVNGRKAGYIGWPPWRLDITGCMKPGSNTVTVTVFGSLKNLLGPHHQGAVRGSAWPGHFLHDMTDQPPGERYDVIEYGLNEPFRVFSADGR